jgi:uncharacterized protein YbjT (DUF2867 family)
MRVVRQEFCFAYDRVMTTALILGATGLVGGHLLDQLLEESSYDRVVAVVRRPTGRTHPKLDERVFDLADLEQHAELFAVNRIFCALGTTIGKAGSQERFRLVDHDYALLAAKLGRARGARHFLVVSSLGASSRSRVFYNRVKGELEEHLRSLVYPSLTLARPSLLLGAREEFRFGESVAKLFGWLMPPGWRPIRASDVARALIVLADEDARGARVVESRELGKIAKKWRDRAK